MSKRKIIKINRNKCTGCGLCIPNCPEGALQMIDGKATLVSDLFCDGLGACIGHCPVGAITIEERDAKPYDEEKVMQNIVKQGNDVVKAHLEHLQGHDQHKYLKDALDYLSKNHIDMPKEFTSKTHKRRPGTHVCPGTVVRNFGKKSDAGEKSLPNQKQQSQLRQWPVQIMLVPQNAPYFDGASLLIAADCVAFSYADFHGDLLKGKILLIGCPKLDDAELYKEKIAQILKSNNIKSVTCAHMEVPCCFGLVNIIKSALESAGKEIPYSEVVIGIKGQKK
ncbi:MAG: 4Fe-4S dicluster domain-containing protein [Candidatus Omnitrophica bacterium]|nr:4Fe-4S dicluster domain-containing protein [Candidatus Omnitrophota bacterium]